MNNIAASTPLSTKRFPIGDNIDPYTDVLTIVDGNKVSQDHVLDETKVTFGRSKKNDVTLDHDAISRHHFAITKTGDGWAVIDLNSTNGVFYDGSRLQPQKQILWNQEQPLVVGPYTINWDRHYKKPAQSTISSLEYEEKTTIQPPDLSPYKEQAALYYDEHIETEQASEKVLVTLKPEKFTLNPGETVPLRIDLLNLSGRPETYQVRLHNLPSHWIDRNDDLIRLDPHMSNTVTFNVSAPAMGIVADAYDFEVRVIAENDPSVSAVVSGSVVIQEYHRFRVAVTEDHRRSTSVLQVKVINEGNAPDIYQIRETNTNSNVRLTASQWQMALTPGTYSSAHIHVEPIRRPLFGSANYEPIQLEVYSSSGLRDVYRQDVTITPKISWPTLAGMAVVIGVAAVIIFLLMAFDIIGAETAAADALSHLIQPVINFVENTISHGAQSRIL